MGKQQVKLNLPRYKIRPTKVLFHVNQEDVCFVGTDNKGKQAQLRLCKLGQGTVFKMGTWGGGRTHNVTQRTDKHILTGGGRTHNITQRTDTHIFTGRGGTHPKCNLTNRHTNFF